ncbi:hypothetical protein Tco_1293337 [Tanacetum coccineum]
MPRRSDELNKCESGSSMIAVRASCRLLLQKASFVGTNTNASCTDVQKDADGSRKLCMSDESLPIFDNKRALDTHKLILRRSPWQDVILAIHSLQSKGINLMDFIQKKVGNGENTSFWDDSWLREVALKVLYKRLYALEMCKSISVAEKMGHPSLSHSFRRMPRGGVEQKNYGLLCSKVADLTLPNISDR